MMILLVIFGVVIVVLLFLLMMQRREIKSILKQLERISKQDSNEMIHSENGRFSDELINEINALLKEMRHSKVQYQQRSHQLDQMITNISHDLRTPLTSAMGYVDIVLNSDLLPEEQEKQIHIVEQRLSQLEELLQSFFEFSRIISGGHKPEIEAINLVEVLQESMVHYYDDFCEQEREIIFICAQRELTLLSNRNMLMRIFDNLIGNAYKHGEGNLTVKLLSSEDICICFENALYDTDIDINRIFDEFYTTDISRTKGHTGLGLAIAKQFVQMLGGEIRANYEEGIFEVEIQFHNRK